MMPAKASRWIAACAAGLLIGALVPSARLGGADFPVLPHTPRRVTGPQVPFIVNAGLVDNGAVRFYAYTFGGTVFVEDGGVVTYNLAGEDGAGAIIREVVSDRGVRPFGVEASATRVSYFQGKDPEAWRSAVGTFSMVSFGEVCEGVVLSLRAAGDNVEKIYTVSPGASARGISVRVEGAGRLLVNADGELELETPSGVARFTRPVAYQEDIDGGLQQVEAAYRLLGEDSYGFDVGSYDPARPLTIDPLLASTFVGNWSHDYGYAVAVDSSGNVYIAGQSKRDSLGRSYYTTPGAYNSTENPDWEDYDVIVSKLNSDLSVLLASTFVRGASGEYASSLELDADGNVVVAGLTGSPDFPTTAGACDETHNGSSDVFVLRLNNDLSTLMASTFVGGSHTESHFETGMGRGPDLAIDGEGNIYLAGITYSSDFPITPGEPSPAYQTSKQGADEVFVCRLSGDLSTLEAGTYLGGAREDRGTAIAVDDWRHVFVAGHTDSTNNPGFNPPMGPFPVTAGAYDTTYNDSLGALTDDGFVSRFDADLTTLEASAFLGSSQTDRVWALAVDSFGYVYVGAFTHFNVEPYFPTTPGAYKESLSGGYDAAVSKFSNDLSTLEAGTFLGGVDGDDRINGIAIDAAGDVWVTGYTYSDDFPTTPGAYDDATNFSAKDVFVSKLKGDLSQLLESTHIGGSGYTEAWDIEVRSEPLYLPGQEFPVIAEDHPAIYVAGSSEQGAIPSSYHPTTPDAFDRVAHNYDVFITVFGNGLTEAELISCDEKWAPQDRFVAGEGVYVRGLGLPASAQYRFWILPEGSLAEGYDLAGNSALDPSGTQETASTSSSGMLVPVSIWDIPPDAEATDQEWDIVADRVGVGEGVFNAADDYVDSAGAIGFVAPLVRDPGDVDGDGQVGINDLALVAAAFGSGPMAPHWDPAADLDRDGLVNVFDVVIVGLNFGVSPGP